jgi:polar amino acid transport system substrate-binding protein
MCATILLASFGARAEEFVVVSDYWYPYNGVPDSDREGYMVDLIRSIAKSNGHTIDYRLLDWEQALEHSLAGKGEDCVVGAVASDAPKHARTSAAWGLSQNQFYAHADRMPALPDLAALANYRIGVVAEYSYGETIDEILAANPKNVFRTKASRKAFPMLAMRLVTRQVDVVIEDQNVAMASIAEMKITSIRAVPQNLVQPDDIFVACTPNPRGRGFIAQLDAGLTKARQSGELKKILARYGLKDWAATAP